MSLMFVQYQPRIHMFTHSKLLKRGNIDTSVLVFDLICTTPLTEQHNLVLQIVRKRLRKLEIDTDTAALLGGIFRPTKSCIFTSIPRVFNFRRKRTRPDTPICGSRQCFRMIFCVELGQDELRVGSTWGALWVASSEVSAGVFSFSTTFIVPSEMSDVLPTGKKTYHARTMTHPCAKKTIYIV